MTAPQVTPADVEAAIASEHYFTAGEGVIGAFAAGEFDSHGSDVVILRRDIASTEVMKPSLNLLTFCVLVLKNGHLVTGEALLQDLSKPDTERARASARRRALAQLQEPETLAKVLPAGGPLLGRELCPSCEHAPGEPRDNPFRPCRTCGYTTP